MDPTVSYYMLLGGLLVAYIEFIRPGLVVPGVTGGIVAMWGFSRLVASGLNWEAAAVFLMGALLLVCHAWFWMPRSAGWLRWERGMGGAGVLGMWWGSAHLVNEPVRINPQAAEIGVGLFALVTVPLLAAAFRARRNKAIL
jgi:membrane-bound serine protease (ClpP class)